MFYKKISAMNFEEKNVKGSVSANWLMWGILLITTLVGSGCNKEDNSDEYYIKYEVSSTTIYYGGKLNVTITNETNSNSLLIIDTRTPWEAVIGPVKKGFNANLNVEGPGDSHLKLYTQISASKNNGPFALKKVDGSDDPRNSCQLSYTIDF